MAKAKVGGLSGEKKDSKFTGLFWPCNENRIRHARDPVAIPIRLGPKKCYLSCICGYFSYLDPDWDPGEGMTMEQAESEGLRPLFEPRNAR